MSFNHVHEIADEQGDRAAVAFGIAAVLVYIVVILPRLSLVVDYDWYDSIQYYFRALALATDRGYVALEVVPNLYPMQALAAPPLVPVILSLPMALFGASMAVAKVAYYALSVLCVAALYVGLKAFVEREVAALLVFVVLLTPMSLHVTPYINTDIPFLSFSIFLLACFWRYIRQSQARAVEGVLLGAGFSALVLLRYAGVSWLLGAGLWLVIEMAFRRDRTTALRFAWFVVGVLAAVIPAVIWMAHQSPEFFRLYYSWHRDGRPSQRMMSGLTTQHPNPLVRTAAIIVENVSSYAGIVINEGFIGIYDGPVFGPSSTLAAAALAGLYGIGIWKRRGDKAAWLPAYFTLFHMLPYLVALTRPQMRYALPALALLWIPIAWGLKATVDFLSGSVKRIPVLRLITPAALLAVTVWFAALGMPLSIRCYAEGREARYSEQTMSIVETARWIGAHYPPTTVVFSPTIMRIALHSHLPGVKVPESGDSLEGFAELVTRYDEVVMVAAPEFKQPEYDQWIAEHAEYLREVYAVNTITVYDVDIPGLRASLPPDAPTFRLYGGHGG